MADDIQLVSQFWWKFSVILGCCSLLLFETIVFTTFSPERKYKCYRAQFVIVINLVFVVGSRYLWKRLVRDVITTAWPKHIELFWKFGVVTFLFLAHFAPASLYFLSKEPTFLGMASWTCFGAYVLIFSILVSVGIVAGILEHFLNSRCFSKRLQAVFTVFTTTLCTYAAFQIALSPPQIVSVEVPVANLPVSMDKLKIALISDVHLGPTVGYTLLNRVVDATKALDPDIVVLSGDLTDGSVKDLGEAALPLEKLQPRYGMFFVTGNHEYYTGDVENWFKFLKQMGFHILHNSNVKVKAPTDPTAWFCMLGTDDIQADQISYGDHGMKLSDAYEGCDSSHAAILVAHQPRAAKMALDSQHSIQLVLSGHTHGGQIYPIVWLAGLANPYMSGLYQHGPGKYVYVSQGSVYYGFPLRLGTFPEITNITLRAA